MKLVIRSIVSIIRTPSLVIAVGIIVGLATIISANVIEPISASVAMFSQIGSETAQATFSDSLISYALVIKTVIEFMKNPMYILLLLAGAIVASVFIGALLSLAFSGIFGKLFRSFEKSKKTSKGSEISIINETKKNFLKTWMMNSIYIMLSIVILLISMVAVVPGFMYISSDNAGMIGFGVVLTIISALVILMMFLFLFSYLSFWYPAVFSEQKGMIRHSKKVVDKYFFGIMIRTFATLVIFIVANYLINVFSAGVVAPYKIIGLILKWLFNTIYIAYVISYFFEMYKFLNKKYNGSVRKKENN
ncbi:MAG: hypothetical protein WCQ41_05740 [Bacillota bacterium]